MATGRVKTELEESRCSICLETPRDPTTLPCQHAFCKTCISQYVKETETKQNYSCPVCRTDLSSEKQQILAFGNSTQKEMETMDKFKCGPCREKGKDTLAINWCRDCQDSFCENCSVDHSSFKSLKNHEVSSLEELRGRKDVRFLVDFSNKCPLHPELLTEAYCFDHSQLCCISCVTTTHRKCEDTRAIKDILSKERDFKNSNIVTFKSDLLKIQTATDEYLKEKKADKSQVEQSFLDIEESVNITVRKIKDNLDTLVISFRKELHLKQDDFEPKVDPKIKEVETFRETIANALQNIEFVRNYGTGTHLFIYFEKTKDEIKRIVEDRIEPILQTSKLEIQLSLNDVIRSMEQLSNLGTVELLEKSDQASSTFRAHMNGTFCKLVKQTSIDTIRVKRDKVIETGDQNTRGGTSIDDTTILVACGKKISVFDIATAKKVKEYETSVGFNPKRLSYEEKSKYLYISFFAGYLHRMKYDHTHLVFSLMHAIRSVGGSPLNGGVCNDGQSFYTIVDKGVCKNENAKTNIFKTDTNCSGFNGLAFDKKNKRFIYTSSNNEVVAISEKGNEIFRLKDSNMKTVSSVAILDCGIIIAGDETGSVHAISEDGKQRKTLIDKCEKITTVCDVWVDKDSKTLFVCGNSFVEIYNIE